MPKLHPVERLAALLTVAGALITTVLGNPPLALGLALGGVFAVVNFYLLRALMVAIVASEQPPRQAGLALLLVLKFALMGTVLYFLLRQMALDPLGLLIGISLVVVSILIEGFRSALRGSAARAQESSSDG